MVGNCGNNIRRCIKLFLVGLITAVLYGCLDGGSDSGTAAVTTEETTTDTVLTLQPFPTVLGVASPLDIVSTVTTSNHTDSSGKRLASNVGEHRGITASVFDSTEIDAQADDLVKIIAGTLAIGTALDPSDLYETGTSPECYAPKVLFSDHPDGASTTAVPPGDGNGDGTPASGDILSSFAQGQLGMWTDKEGETEEACSAATVNYQMESIKNRSSFGFKMVASLIRIYLSGIDTTSEAWFNTITTGGSVNVTSSMNGLGLTGIDFSSATITRSLSAQFKYDITFDYTSDGVTNEVEIVMVHNLGATDDVYEGLLTYRIDNTNSDSGCTTSSVTDAGSVHFLKNSASDLRMQAREAQLCGHGTDALGELVQSDTIVEHVLDPNLFWDNSFKVLTSQTNPATLIGNYSFSWQASRTDDVSRIFNIDLNSTSAGSLYFGFGATVESFDGIITGFLCNPAGPGTSADGPTPQEMAQRQAVVLNPSSGLFEIVSDADSNVTYAPTSSCSYDSTGVATDVITIASVDRVLTADEIAALEITAGTQTVGTDPAPVATTVGNVTTTVATTVTATVVLTGADPDAVDPALTTAVTTTTTVSTTAFFRYDRDNDGLTSDETAQTAAVFSTQALAESRTAPTCDDDASAVDDDCISTPQTLGLLQFTSTGATDIETEITTLGFVHPLYPTD